MASREKENNEVHDFQQILEQKDAEIYRLKEELLKEQNRSQQAGERSIDYWPSIIKILDLVPVMIYIADREQLLYINPLMSDKLGYTAEECVGMEAWWVVAPEYRDMIKYAGMARMSGVNAAAYEIKLLHKDGRQIYGLLSSERILYQGRDAVIGFVHDIDKPKRMEEKVTRADRLESLGVLAGGIAHDFNNMLTVIQGNASLLKSLGMRAFGQEDAHLLHEIETATDQAQLLTNQLLTFSKGGGTPIRENISLQEFICDTVNFHLRGSNVKCKYTIPAQIWPLNIDRGQIGQVFQNLVINACQAMPQGGMLEISAANSLVEADNSLDLFPGCYVRINFRDHGAGIAPEIIDKIYDPYYTTKHGGHGLGLATAYSIIMNHAGAIRVESELGQGTSFVLMLPAAEELPAETAPNEIKSEQGGGCILVMDDEGMIRISLGRMLIYLGYGVDFAQHGSEAIAKYEQTRQKGRTYSAVIMDLTIAGGMGGLETLEELRKMDPGIRAILSSGYSNDPVVTDFKSYGFCGLVPKPYRIEDLSKVLNEIFAGEPAAAE